MYRKMRTTSSGVEWWNTLLKRTEVFPKEVDPNENIVESADKTFGVNDGETNYDLATMKMAELKELAEKYNIDIPSDIKKRDDIAEYIFTNWKINAAADAQ